jgi:hypothetical protein
LLRGAKFSEPADLDKVKELLDGPGDIDQIAE